MIDGTARVVVRSTPMLPFEQPYSENPAADWAELEAAATVRNRAIVESSTIEQWMPSYTLETGGDESTGQLVPCERVSHPVDFSGLHDRVRADCAAVTATGSTPRLPRRCSATARSCTRRRTGSTSSRTAGTPTQAPRPTSSSGPVVWHHDDRDPRVRHHRHRRRDPRRVRRGERPGDRPVRDVRARGCAPGRHHRGRDVDGGRTPARARSRRWASRTASSSSSARSAGWARASRSTPSGTSATRRTS